MTYIPHKIIRAVINSVDTFMVCISDNAVILSTIICICLAPAEMSQERDRAICLLLIKRLSSFEQIWRLPKLGGPKTPSLLIVGT